MRNILLLNLLWLLTLSCFSQVQPKENSTRFAQDSIINFKTISVKLPQYPGNEIKLYEDGTVKLKSSHNMLMKTGDYLGTMPQTNLHFLQKQLYKSLILKNFDQNLPQEKNHKLSIDLEIETSDSILYTTINEGNPSNLFNILNKTLLSDSALYKNKMTYQFYGRNERKPTLEHFSGNYRVLAPNPTTLGVPYLLGSGKLSFVNNFEFDKNWGYYNYVLVSYDSITQKTEYENRFIPDSTIFYIYKLKLDHIYESTLWLRNNPLNSLKQKYIYCLTNHMLDIDLNLPIGIVGEHHNIKVKRPLSNKEKTLSYLEITDLFNPNKDYRFSHLEGNTSQFLFPSNIDIETNRKLEGKENKLMRIITKDIKKNHIVDEVDPNYHRIFTKSTKITEYFSLKKGFKKLQVMYFKFRVKTNSWRTLDIAQQHGYWFLFDKEFAYGIIVDGQMRIVIIDSYPHYELNLQFRNKNEEFLIKLKSYSTDNVTLFKEKERKYEISEFQYNLSLEDLKKLKDAKIKNTYFWGISIEKLQNNFQLKSQIKREYRRRLREKRRTIK